MNISELILELQTLETALRGHLIDPEKVEVDVHYGDFSHAIDEVYLGGMKVYIRTEAEE